MDPGKVMNAKYLVDYLKAAKRLDTTDQLHTFPTVVLGCLEMAGPRSLPLAESHRGSEPPQGGLRAFSWAPHIR